MSEGKTAFVTGADGFIGSHLVERLVLEGWRVRAMVYYNSFNSWGWLDTSPCRDSIEVVEGDVRDPVLMRSCIEGCDAVFHLAALISIPFSYHAPHAYVQTNIVGTLNVVQAAREARTPRVIVTSTSEVYGTARFVPITEKHPLQGQSPYSASKIGADQIALSFHATFGVPVVVLRPFNTYGPRQSARAVIPTIITQLASGKRQLKLGALHPTRDFSFVSDTVSGFLAAATANEVIGKVINVGSGFEISIGDTAKLIAEIMGVDVKVVQDDARIRPADSEVERLFAGVEEAKRLMNWTPAYGGREGFGRGLAQTIDWFQDPTALARYKHDRYNY